MVIASLHDSRGSGLGFKAKQLMVPEETGDDTCLKQTNRMQ